jgi:hypothetical protein
MLQELIHQTKLEEGLKAVNRLLAEYEAWQIVALTAIAVVVIQTLWHLLVVEEAPYLTRIKYSVFAVAKKIPFVKVSISIFRLVVLVHILSVIFYYY